MLRDLFGPCSTCRSKALKSWKFRAYITTIKITWRQSWWGKLTWKNWLGLAMVTLPTFYLFIILWGSIGLTWRDLLVTLIIVGAAATYTAVAFNLLWVKRR